MKPEQVIIVDRNDKIIGYKNRGDLKRSDIYRVSALWLENFNDEILLAQRAFCKKHDPGLWGPAVAGTVVKGESYRKNLTKESKEEIDLENLVLIKSKKIFITGKFNFFCQWYMTIVNKDIKEFKIDKVEVEGIEWFPRKKLSKELEQNPQNFLPIIKKCLEWFK